MADPHSSHPSKLPKATTLGSGLDRASPFSFGLTGLESIPDLIDNMMVSVSDVNSVLFVIDELPIIDKAETLMASLFLVWLAAKLPVADHDCIKFHNALAALCRFCNFPPAGYDLRPYTAVSPVPPGTILPPALSPTRVTDDCDMDTDSDGGPPAALDVPMIVPTCASTEHLRTPTPQPERKGKMKEAPPHLVVKPAPAPKVPPPTPSDPQKALTSYAVAAATLKPAKPAPQGTSKTWTPKGNLVVFARPDMSRDQLSATSHLLTSAVATSLPDVSMHISSRLNVRWGKVLVNRVHIGITDDSSAAHSPSVCLQDLLENNPSLRPLKVTQLPSWVWAPRLFQPGSSSSLVFFFFFLNSIYLTSYRN